MTLKQLNKTVLLVDDDPIFLKGLMYSMKQLGYETVLAENGKVAVEKLKSHHIDAIVSDINMPKGTGLQLLTYVKKSFSIPVILMTGLSDLKETTAAIQLGAKSFLSKPFKKDELSEALAQCFSSDPAEDLSIGSEMIKLHLEEFITGTKMDFNIYLRTNDSFIKVSSGGEYLTADDVFDYRKNVIDFLYTKKEEFIHYLGLNDYVTSSIDRTKKLELFRDVEKNIEDLSFLRSFNEAAFLRAYVHVTTTLDILTDNKETLNLMMNIRELGGHHFSLSIRVAFFTSLISQYMGNISTVDYFKLISAGVFLDLGISVRRLSEAEDLPEEVKLMIEEHSLNAGNSQRLTKILAIAKSFLSIPFAVNDFQKSIEKFSISSLGKHDLNVLQALLLVFNVAVPQELVEYQLSKLGA